VGGGLNADRKMRGNNGVLSHPVMKTDES